MKLDNIFNNGLLDKINNGAVLLELTEQGIVHTVLQCIIDGDNLLVDCDVDGYEEPFVFNLNEEVIECVTESTIVVRETLDATNMTMNFSTISPYSVLAPREFAVSHSDNSNVKSYSFTKINH
jgi:hypothetical protein